MSANERQVGGDHYKGDGEEHWDRVIRLKLNYLEGNITKYIERARKKNGIQDLLKAKHYLEKLIEEVEAGRIEGYTPSQPQSKAELIEQTDKIELNDELNKEPREWR
jgi:hypothetical protein